MMDLQRCAAPASPHRIKDDACDLPDGRRWYAAYEHVEMLEAGEQELKAAGGRARDRMLLRAQGEGFAQDGLVSAWSWRHQKNGYWTVGVEMHARKETP